MVPIAILRTALFFGFNIKPASENHTQAELHISIWIAASLCKKEKLARSAKVSFEPAATVELEVARVQEVE